MVQFKMVKVLIVFGTRPEAIKLAPLIMEFRKYAKLFDLKICVTAQHREMLDQVLDLFQIKPDYDLDIMRPGQDLNELTSKLIVGIKKVLVGCKPDIVLVHGDTTTSFVASLGSFYQNIPVGHIEAGLRTDDIKTPFPEEANRRLTGVIAEYHFAPTVRAANFLLNEGKEANSIIVTGNTVVDALYYTLNKIRENSILQNKIYDTILNFGYDLLRMKKIILVTAHRRENHGQGFVNMCNAFIMVANKNKNIDIVFPVHLNPNITNIAKKLLGDIPNIFLIAPLGYKEFVYLMDKSYLILTDSGGIQEEAPSLGKPVVVMRDSTERHEAFTNGLVRLVGSNTEKIFGDVNLLINNVFEYKKMQTTINPYGDGTASYQIVKFLRGRYG